MDSAHAVGACASGIPVETCVTIGRDFAGTPEWGMEVHQIRYFLTVCDTLNFTRAAEQCNVSQPALTRAIKALEDELGGQLLRRERNRTHLTELGRMVREPLVRALTETERAKKSAAAFRSMAETTLCLGVMCTIGPKQLMGMMRHLHDTLPGIQLQLKEGTPASLVESLVQGDIELAIASLPEDHPQRLDVIPLYRERLVIAFPPGHRFEQKNAIRLDDMEGEDYLLRLDCELRPVIRRMQKERAISLKIRYRSNREDWIQSMVMAGMGCAFMPEHMPMLPDLPTRPVREKELEREVCLAMVAGRQFSPAVRAFVALAAKFSERIREGNSSAKK